MTDQQAPPSHPQNNIGNPAASSPLLPPPNAPNLAKSRRSRPNAASIRRTQRALAQRERDRARAVDAQTHQVAHPLEDYLDHIRYNEAKLDRPRAGSGAGADVVAASPDSAAAAAVTHTHGEDPAAQDYGLPVTVYDLAAAMVHDYCARHAASVGAAAAAGGSVANSPEVASGGRGRKASAAAAANRAKSPPLAASLPSLSTVGVVMVDPADVARTSAFLRKVVTVAGIASSSVLFAMMLVDRLRQISLPAAHQDLLSNADSPGHASTSAASRRRSSRSRSRPRNGTAPMASPRPATSTLPTPLSASTSSLGAYSALSLSALDESRPSPLPTTSTTSTRRKSTTAIDSASSSDPPILFTPLYAPPLPATPRQLPFSATSTPPRSRAPSSDTPLPPLHTATSNPSLSTLLRKRSVTSSLPTLSLSTTNPAPPTSPLTSPLLPLFPTLIHPSPVTARIWHPPPVLFITALMLADKSLFDSVYRASDWAIFTPYSPLDLVAWEHDLCAALAWDVAPPASLDAWTEWIGRVQMALILGGRVRPRGADPSYFEVGLIVGRRMGARGGVGGWAQAAVEVVARSAVGVVGEEAAVRAARVVGVVGVVVAWLAVVVGRLGGG